MSEKKYYGNVKTHTFSNGDEMYKIGLSADDLNHMLSQINEKGYVNLNMTKRKDVGQYGQTHSIVLDDWKPTQTATQGGASEPQGTAVNVGTVEESDLPF